MTAKMSALIYASRNFRGIRQALLEIVYTTLYTGEIWQIDFKNDKPIKEDSKRVYAISDKKTIKGFSNRGVSKSIQQLPILLVGAFMAIIRANPVNVSNDDEMIKLANTCFNKGLSIVWKTAQSYDGDKRKEAIYRCMQDARLEDKYLWLCSAHGDPAIGHEDYQGKYYYDEKAPRAVVEWAMQNNIQSYQWVIDNPVYMLTRPNCRHYMTPVSLSFAKSTTSRDATNILGLYSVIGERGSNQTLPQYTNGLLSKEIYSIRLEFHQEANKLRPSAKLVGLINKDLELLSRV